MPSCFSHLGDERTRADGQAALAAIRAAWKCLDGERADVSACLELLHSVDERLRVEPGEKDLDWVVTYDAIEARGMAEVVAAQARDLRVGVGRPAQPLEPLLRDLLERTGRDLSRARVRVGFTRGHLLEVLVGLPPQLALDRSTGSGAELDPQEIAEWLVEGLLGETLVDDWVAAIDTTVLPREGLLRVVQPATTAPEMFALAELSPLLGRAVAGVDEQLPRQPRWAGAVGAEWTWLEIEPDVEGVQADRVAAVTWLPELLKCALEGLPFHSRRFSRCEERFVWLEAPAERGAEREQRREHIERALDRVLRERRQGALIGTGFGPRYDYFDLCLSPGDDALRTVLEVGQRLQLRAPSQLRFYDSRWAEEGLPISA